MSNSTSDALAALNFEVAVGNEWNTLREDFRVAFIRRFQGTGRGSTNVSIPGTWRNSIREPTKFRRHSVELLGKWVLAQKAREPQPGGFLPQEAKNLYHDQLIRDLTMKCTDERQKSQDFIKSVADFVRKYPFSDRIEAIRSRVEKAAPLIQGIQPGRVEGEESSRVEGARVEMRFTLSDDFTSRASSQFAEILKRLAVPEAAWTKLMKSYDFFNKGGSLDEGEQVKICRAACVVVRYELNLMSGSLQLCADSGLKNSFRERGHHVVDLCASPINAFMGADGSSNYFCSAFPDVDRFFGSVGSVMNFSIGKLIGRFESDAVLPVPDKLMLTLDVPYDEDLCELMFMKLDKDLREKEFSIASVAYVLVIPLWWNLIFEHAKKEVVGCTEEKMAALLESGEVYHRRGFQIDYKWPQTLVQSSSVVFDANFLSNEYTYYCSSTNKKLSGVTGTEVIGFESLSGAGSGEVHEILKVYYEGQTESSEEPSRDTKRKREDE